MLYHGPASTQQACERVRSGGLYSAVRATRTTHPPEQEMDNFSNSILTAAASNCGNREDGVADHPSMSMRHSPELGASNVVDNAGYSNHKQFDVWQNFPRRLEDNVEIDSILDHPMDSMAFVHGTQTDQASFLDEFNLDYRPQQHAGSMHFPLEHNSLAPTDQHLVLSSERVFSHMANFGELPSCSNGAFKIGPQGLKLGPSAMQGGQPMGYTESTHQESTKGRVTRSRGNTSKPEVTSDGGQGYSSGWPSTEPIALKPGTHKTRQSAKEQAAAAAAKAGAQNGRSDDDLMRMDPKRAKRILANRQSAARSKERRLRYATELEDKYTTLQSEFDRINQDLEAMRSDNSAICKANVDLDTEIHHLQHRHAHLAQENKSYTKELFSLQASLAMEQALPELPDVRAPNGSLLPPLPDLKLKVDFGHAHPGAQKMQEDPREGSPHVQYARPRTMSVGSWEIHEANAGNQGHTPGLPPLGQPIRREMSLPNSQSVVRQAPAFSHVPALRGVVPRQQRFSDPGILPGRVMQGGVVIGPHGGGPLLHDDVNFATGLAEDMPSPHCNAAAATGVPEHPAHLWGQSGLHKQTYFQDAVYGSSVSESFSQRTLLHI